MNYKLSEMDIIGVIPSHSDHINLQHSLEIVGTKNHIYANEGLLEKDAKPVDEVLRIDSYQGKNELNQDLEEDENNENPDMIFESMVKFII